MDRDQQDAGQELSDGDDPAMEALLREFGRGPGLDRRDLLWQRVALQLPGRPQPRGLRALLRGMRALGSVQPSRALSGLAAGLVLAVAVSASVLLTTSGSADASFLAAVRGLETAAEHALADGRVSSEEADGLAAQIARVSAALQAPDLAEVSPAAGTAALDALAAVRDRLEALDLPALGQALTTLDQLHEDAPGVLGLDRSAPGSAADDGPPQPALPPQAADAADPPGLGQAGVDDPDSGPPGPPPKSAEDGDDGPPGGPPSDRPQPPRGGPER